MDMVVSCLHEPFEIQRGVRQGSVLSPTLFLVAINPLLKQLEQLNQGVNIGDMYVGAMAHDDVRSVPNTLTALEAQCETVSLYTDQNCLKINVAKCELLTTDQAMDETVCVQVQTAANSQACKCLGIWLDSNLTGKREIE